MKLKELAGLVLISGVVLSQVPTDSIIVSTSEKTVVETTTKEWRDIRFNADPVTGLVNVRVIYESVVRVDGAPRSQEVIRDVTIPWSQATNIAPALVLVREQFKAAMPTILTNTP